MRNSEIVVHYYRKRVFIDFDMFVDFEEEVESSVCHLKMTVWKLLNVCGHTNQVYV